MVKRSMTCGRSFVPSRDVGPVEPRRLAVHGARAKAGTDVGTPRERQLRMFQSRSMSRAARYRCVIRFCTARLTGVPTLAGSDAGSENAVTVNHMSPSLSWS
jgi:hypothetical protein